MENKLTRLDISFDPELDDTVTATLYLHTPWGWQDNGLRDGLRRLTVHFGRPEQSAETEAALLDACPAIVLQTSSEDNADWGSAWKKYFTPIPIGSRFVVVPSWLRDEPQGAQPIVIEPKMAFGTGHHQTTALCLGALDRLSSEGVILPGQSFLDLGTGSGILGIAAAKLGLSGLGLDIDPVAVDNARENAALNSVEDRLELDAGSIDAVAPGRRFDCILANILANPLIDLAEDIAARLASPGVLVLSGILREQADRVASAYTVQGLSAPDISFSGEWALLVFRT
ncbi:MAG: 50S ribosomal protein L11 methyltransferase [Desulfovibrionales bacterium]|nr:50S ribosomal protein L11 methyltransferase [Desulfovibrionales bacterium]